MNILFFIDELHTGGAERQMSVLAKGLSALGHNVRIVTLFPGGKIAGNLKNKPEIELISLWSGKGSNAIVRMFQHALAPLFLRRATKNADCLYSMLEVTNFIAWLATVFMKRPLLIWGIRSSNMESHWKMSFFDQLCALVSPTVKLLIVNSHAGLKDLFDRGYQPQNHTVINNGIDTEYFKYNEDSRNMIRSELGLSGDHSLVGIVGRLDPMKDHPTFLKAAARISLMDNSVKFLCVGGGSGKYADMLRNLVKEIGITDQLTWLGDRTDIAEIYSALDVLVSASSYGEGFPNVIGEAMSCSLPCVATNIGDSSRIVGDPSRIVEARNPEKLAQAIYSALQNNKERLRDKKSRERIIEHYSLNKLICFTEKQLKDHLPV